MGARGGSRGGGWIVAWALALVVASLAFTGCAAKRFEPLALRPEPIPYADTLAIPEPKERKEQRELRALLVHGPIQLAEPIDPGEGEALNLTHDDDVVSSAWWQRRVGYGNITPAQLAVGSAAPENAPATDGPLVIKSVKTEGVTPGFTMKDKNGHTYIVKFDPPGLMHMSSAAGVIGNRLMWGMGFNVPEDYVTEFEFSRLKIDEDATIEDEGGERPLTLDDVRTLLQRTRPIEGERYLAFASKYLSGKPKGPFFFEGTRSDDPNDHFDHQHRRELRALWVFSSWINNTDMREGNTLDMYVEPGYIKHYVIDFGATLGSSSTRSKDEKDETERPVDLYRFIGRVATAGFYKQPWEDRFDLPIAPSIGLLYGEQFHPDSWKSSWTNPAFVDMTHADSYWAAKIVGAFTNEQIDAAVRAGGIKDEAAMDTLAAILRVRRDRIVEFYYKRVTPIEEPLVATQKGDALTLSFRDLGLEQEIWAPWGTLYDWSFSDPSRGRSGSGTGQARSSRDQLLDVSWSSTGTEKQGDGLATLVITSRRQADLKPDPATVFLRWEGQGYRVVGIAHGDPRK